jgi:hypothetical protein
MAKRSTQPQKAIKDFNPNLLPLIRIGDYRGLAFCSRNHLYESVDTNGNTQKAAILANGS